MSRRRYGRANVQIRRSVGRDSVAPSTAEASRGISPWARTAPDQATRHRCRAAGVERQGAPMPAHDGASGRFSPLVAWRRHLRRRWRCGARGHGTHRGADVVDRGDRRHRPPTEADDHRRGRRRPMPRRRRPRDDAALAAAVRARADRVDADRRRRRGGPARGADRLRQPRRRARSSCSSSATSPPTRTSASARCSSTPAAPGSAGRPRRGHADLIYERGPHRPLRHRRLGPARHRAERAVHRLHRRLRRVLRRHRHHARRRRRAPAAHRPSPRSSPTNAPRTTTTSSSSSARTTRPATSTRSAGRSARTRSATSASATASELGATWATLFPDTVRAAVLDGAADPTPTSCDESLQQSRGLRGGLTTFLDQCSADPDCAFHNDGDAEGAFDQLMLKIDDKPLPTDAGRPRSTSGVALARRRHGDVQRVVRGRTLDAALAAAQQGDGAGLLDLYDLYYERRPDGTCGQLVGGASRSSRAWTTDERLTVERRGRRDASSSTRLRRGSSPGRSGATSARSSRIDRPAHRDHRRRRRPDRRVRHHR